MRKRYVGVLIYTPYGEKASVVATLFAEAVDEEDARQQFMRLRPAASYFESLIINLAPTWWQRLTGQDNQE